jgi:hypothetical protein
MTCVRYEWDDLGYSHDSHYHDCTSEVGCFYFVEVIALAIQFRPQTSPLLTFIHVGYVRL